MSMRKNPDGSLTVGIIEDEPIKVKAESVEEDKDIPAETKKKGRPKKEK